MIAASRNQGCVQAALAWAEFGRGAARTVGRSADRAIEWTALGAVSDARMCPGPLS
jgi:hypothetical protein